MSVFIYDSAEIILVRRHYDFSVHIHNTLPVEIQIKMDLDLLVKHLYSL